MAYCSSCGTLIDDNKELCDTCTLSKHVNKKSTKNIEEPSYYYEKKSNKSLILIIICIVLALALGLFVYLYVNEILTKNNIDKLNGQVVSLSTELDKQREYSYQLTTDLSNETALVKELETKLELSQKSVSELEEKLNSSTDNHDALVGDLAVAKNNYETLSKELETAKQTLSEKEAALKAATEELEDYKTSSITDLEAELYQMRNPKAFESIDELTEFIYYDDTDYKFKQLTSLDRGYILYLHLIRNGYFASFTIENAQAGVLVSYIYVFVENSGMYKINPDTDNVFIYRQNQSMDDYYDEVDDYDYKTFDVSTATSFQPIPVVK